MYADYELYISLYGDNMTEQEFNNYLWEAEKRIDSSTTGLGYVKLRKAFPTDEHDAECVKRCVCELINIMKKIHDEEELIDKSSSYMEWEDGTITPRLISSRSAGTESISFSSSSNKSSGVAFDSAVSDYTARNQLFCETIYKYLSGVKDSNGVPLLYMGQYSGG